MEMLSYFNTNTWHKINLSIESSENIRSFKVSEEMFDWCLNYPGNGAFTLGVNSYWFSNNKDAMVFALKWSGVK